MSLKSPTYWLWFAGLTLLALILANTPLFNLLAFEFCAVLAIGISFGAAHIAVTHIRDFRRRPQTVSNTVPVLFWRAFGVSLTLLAAPLIIILLNAFRVRNCDVSEGLVFFTLLPMISCVYGSAAGIFFGLWLKRRWTAYLAFLGYIFVTLLILAENLIFHPPVFAYHATFGYFPGPIYDDQIAITGTLLLARGTTLLLAWIFLLLACNTVEISRETGLIPALRWQKLWRFPLRYNELSLRILLVGLVAIFGGIYLYRGELGLRPTRGYIEKTLGGLKETEHFKIYYEKGSRVEREIDLIADDHEFRYAQLVEYFKIQPARKIKAYIYTSRAQKKRLMGASGTSVEDPFAPGYHINYEEFPHPVMKHELAHALTADWHPILKVSLKLALHEGIAVAADWDEGQLTAHQWSRAMRELGVAPSIQRIMGLGFWGQSSSRSYTLAGSFVRFLVDTYGIEKLKRVFPTGNFQKVYGKPLSELSGEWEAFLETVPLTPIALRIAEHRFKRPSIFQQPCAHELAELSARAWGAYRRSDFNTAVRLFERSQSFDSENPLHLRGLMYTHYHAADYDSAATSAEQIIAHPKASVRRRAEATNVQGDAHWQAGRYERAKTHYRAVFDLHASNALDREAQAKLAALELASDAARDKLKELLIGESSNPLKVTLLHEVVGELPTWGLAYYLIGRNLHINAEYAASNRYLSKAAELGLPHPTLQHENIRLLGVNAYHLREYDQAIAYFQKLADDASLPLGTILNAKDWIERCKVQQAALPVP
jgi:tetratricopeptide (TPR) repeat protein